MTQVRPESSCQVHKRVTFIDKRSRTAHHKPHSEQRMLAVHLGEREACSEREKASTVASNSKRRRSCSYRKGSASCNRPHEPASRGPVSAFGRGWDRHLQSREAKTRERKKAERIRQGRCFYALFYGGGSKQALARDTKARHGSQS